MVLLSLMEYVPVAQLVEHPTFNRTVEGSNPSGHTIPLFPQIIDIAKKVPGLAVEAVRFGPLFFGWMKKFNKTVQNTRKRINAYIDFFSCSGKRLSSN